VSEELMEDELLAPPTSLEPVDEENTEIGGTWHFSHGFADSRQAVRIWVDESTRRLERVRVSGRWRERLAGRSLSDAFGEAFFLANIRFGESRNLEYPEPAAVESDYTGTFEQLLEHLAELDDRMAELESRAPENVRWADFAGEQVRYTGPGGRVTVTLSLAGLTESVELNRDWLASADPGHIADQVLAAHQKAYERYVPPTFVPGEREELAAEFAKAQAALHSLMSKGIA
jgi:DNA-binding protein YbaB